MPAQKVDGEGEGEGEGEKCESGVLKGKGAPAIRVGVFLFRPPCSQLIR